MHASAPHPHMPLARPQDLLTYSLKGLGCWADFAARHGVDVPTEVYSLLNAATSAPACYQRPAVLCSAAPCTTLPCPVLPYTTLSCNALCWLRPT